MRFQKPGLSEIEIMLCIWNTMLIWHLGQFEWSEDGVLEAVPQDISVDRAGLEPVKT